MQGIAIEDKFNKAGFIALKGDYYNFILDLLNSKFSFNIGSELLIIDPCFIKDNGSLQMNIKDKAISVPRIENIIILQSYDT